MNRSKALRLAWSLLALSGAAQTRAVVSVTCDLPRTVTLHEPVLMDLVLRNDTDQPAFVDISHPTSFTFNVIKPNGGSVTPAIREYRGETFEGAADVPPKYHFEHQVVLDGFLDFSQVGTYMIYVQFGGRVEPRDGSARVIVPPPLREFSLRVLPRDPERLRSICEKALPNLRFIGIVRHAAAKRLAWIRDPVAVPCPQKGDRRLSGVRAVLGGVSESRLARGETGAQGARPE